MASTLPPLQQPLYQIPTPSTSGSPTPRIPGAYGPRTGDTPGLEATSIYENWDKLSNYFSGPKEPMPEPGSPEAWKHEASSGGSIAILERSKTLSANAAKATADAAKTVLPNSVATSLGLTQPAEPASTPQGNQEDFKELPKLPPPGLTESSTNTMSYVDQSKSMITSASQTLSNAATSVLPASMSQTLGLSDKEVPTEEKDTPQSPIPSPTHAPPPGKGLQTASEFVAATKHLPPVETGPHISAVTGDPIVAKSISPDADVQEAASKSPHDYTTTIPGLEPSTTKKEMLGGPEIQPSVDVEPGPKTTVKITAANVQHPTIGYATTADSEGSTPVAPTKPHLATQPTVASMSSTAAVVGSSRNSMSAPSSKTTTDVAYSPVSPQVNNSHMGDQQQHSRDSSSGSLGESPASPAKSGHSRMSSAGKVSLKNKLKGEFKVVKGKIKKDEELVQEGKMLKSGLMPE